MAGPRRVRASTHLAAGPVRAGTHSVQRRRLTRAQVRRSASTPVHVSCLDQARVQGPALTVPHWRSASTLDLGFAPPTGLEPVTLRFTIKTYGLADGGRQRW